MILYQILRLHSVGWDTGDDNISCWDRMCMEGITRKRTVTNFPLWVTHPQCGQSEPSVPDSGLQACPKTLI